MVDGFVSPFVSASVHSQSEERAWGIYHIWQSYRFLSHCLYSVFMKHRIYEKENFWGSIIWRWTSYLAKFEVCPNWDLQRMFDHYSVASTGPFAFTDTLSSRSSTFFVEKYSFFRSPYFHHVTLDALKWRLSILCFTYAPIVSFFNIFRFEHEKTLAVAAKAEQLERKFQVGVHSTLL